MNTVATKILLVDDDQELCELLGDYLRLQQLDVDCAHSGVDALTVLEADSSYAAVVLDIMMPGITGLDVLQKLRPANTVPVIMLTGRGDDIDRIVGLEMGADDYLTKPCNPRELLARIRAVLRRANASPEVSRPVPADELRLHGISVSPGLLSANVNGVDLNLTGAEFHTLQLLMQQAGQTISKQELTEQVLQRKLEAYDRSIDVHISRLRQKLSMQGVDGIIKSVRGQGYQLLTTDGHGD
jgi:two component transcriptional regulator, winged helix family